MSEYGIMDSRCRTNAGCSTRSTASPLSGCASQSQDSSDDITSPDDLWSVSRSPGSSHASSAPSVGPGLVDGPDQWGTHVSMDNFMKNLEGALTEVFPNRDRSRYKNVYVLLMKWGVGDPRLPVFKEMDELRRVFEDIFHFQVEVFEIPEERSHRKVNQKIIDFSDLGGDSSDDLKIVYYAGHSRSNESRNLLFSRQACLLFLSFPERSAPVSCS